MPPHPQTLYCPPPPARELHSPAPEGQSFLLIGFQPPAGGWSLPGSRQVGAFRYSGMRQATLWRSGDLLYCPGSGAACSVSGVQISGGQSSAGTLLSLPSARTDSGQKPGWPYLLLQVSGECHFQCPRSRPAAPSLHPRVPQSTHPARGNRVDRGTAASKLGLSQDLATFMSHWMQPGSQEHPDSTSPTPGGPQRSGQEGSLKGGAVGCQREAPDRVLSNRPSPEPRNLCETRRN